MKWIKRLLGPLECDHDWKRIAASWFAYEADPGKHFVICSKCGARETREDTRS